MGDAAFRGVSAEQDGRFRNKEKAMLKQLTESGQFPAHFDQRLDVKKVNMDVMRPWIAERVGQLLGFEDDVVVEYVNGLLDDGARDGRPDARKMQINLVGFLESNTATFMSELWALLLSAQSGIGGIPQEFVEKKKEEMRRAREQDAAILARSGITRHEGRRTEDRRYDGARGDRGSRASYRDSRSDRFSGNGDRRREFVDKNGQRTERVRDAGWSERAPLPHFPNTERPPYDTRDRYSANRRRSASPVRRESRHESRHDEHSRHSEWTRTEIRRKERSPTYSPSLSPPPRSRTIDRDEKSPTPVLRKNRVISSPSVTPPRRQRSPTYSPEPHHSTSSKRRARCSRSRSASR